MTTAGSEPTSSARHWADDLLSTLRHHQVSIVSYVPDGGHKHLIELSIADNEITTVPLTIEFEGVALAVGAYLGGKRSVLLMQSSGVGNCINMLSLVQNVRSPFLTLVSMRGEHGEGNPWQMSMGNAVQPTLTAMGVRCLKAAHPEEVSEVVSAAATMAFQGQLGVAVLLSQRLTGAKKFEVRGRQ